MGLNWNWETWVAYDALRQVPGLGEQLKQINNLAEEAARLEEYFWFHIVGIDPWKNKWARLVLAKFMHYVDFEWLVPLIREGVQLDMPKEVLYDPTRPYWGKWYEQAEELAS